MKNLLPIFGLLIVIGIGCQSETPKEKTTTTSQQSTAPSQRHSHGAGPHDGAVADWGGGKFHVEFTVNHDKKEATVHILGADQKTPVPIDAKEIQLDIEDPKLTAKLIAKPLDGEADGKSSRFVGNHDSLSVVKEYKGTISGTVDGTPYSGNFEEVAH